MLRKTEGDEITVKDDEIINESHLNDCKDKKLKMLKTHLWSLQTLRKIQSKTMKLHAKAM